MASRGKKTHQPAGGQPNLDDGNGSGRGAGRRRRTQPPQEAPANATGQSPPAASHKKRARKKTGRNRK